MVLLLSVLVVMSFTQVVLRQFFGTGILWGDTFLRHLVLWVGFLGASLATADNKQFAWDTLVTFLKEKPRAIVGLIAHLVTGLITGCLIHASWAFCMEEKASESVLFNIGSTAVPSWAFLIILPAGFALVLFHTLVKAVEEARRI